MKHFLIKYRRTEGAVKELGERDFFSAYTKRTEQVAGEGVEVLPMEIVAETRSP